MICQPCQTAGDLNQQKKIKQAKNKHGACWGCECQHQTGTGWFVRKGEAVPPMRTQSP
jgi:hypothetical protein